MNKYIVTILSIICFFVNFKIFASNSNIPNFEGYIWKSKKCGNYGDSILSGKYNYDFTVSGKINTFISYYENKKCLNKLGQPTYQINGSYEITNITSNTIFTTYELTTQLTHLTQTIKLYIKINNKMMQVCYPNIFRCKEYEKSE